MLKVKELSLYLLPNLLAIVEHHLDRAEFMKLVYPSIEREFLKGERPPAIDLIMLKNLGMLCERSDHGVVSKSWVPLLVEAFSTSSQDVIFEVLNQIPKIAVSADPQQLKVDVMPRLELVCVKTSSNLVKERALNCISQLVPILDKPTVEQSITPILERTLVSPVKTAMMMDIIIAVKRCSIFFVRF